MINKIEFKGIKEMSLSISIERSAFGSIERSAFGSIERSAFGSIERSASGSNFVDVDFTKDQLTNKADKDYKKFTAALGLIFDVDFTLIAHLCNYDYIDPPPITEACNYAQWITLPSNERNPIGELFAYLFTTTDDVWDEPFEFTKEELKLRTLHLEKIKSYGNAANYFKQCSINLWKDENYLQSEYFYYIKHIDKLIATLPKTD